jgi:hypothetical protein
MMTFNGTVFPDMEGPQCHAPLHMEGYEVFVIIKAWMNSLVPKCPRISSDIPVGPTTLQLLSNQPGQEGQGSGMFQEPQTLQDRRES